MAEYFQVHSVVKLYVCYVEHFNCADAGVFIISVESVTSRQVL